jgi:hypothetical protein
MQLYTMKMEEHQVKQLDDEYNYNQLFLRYCQNQQAQM